LKCISPEEGKQILDEIHSSCCGNHAASRTLVGKVFSLATTGLRHSKMKIWFVTANHASSLLGKHTSLPTNSFASRHHGLSPARGLIWLDHSREPSEASSTSMWLLTSLQSRLSTNLWSNSLLPRQSNLCRAFFTNRIITDLRSPFTAKEFRAWASDCGISIDYASMAHPQANRQVE
jgi:hypothetical protein